VTKPEYVMNRYIELDKERIAKQLEEEKKKKEEEMEKALIRQKEGFFFVPDRTQGWADEFVKKMDVLPVAEKIRLEEQSKEWPKKCDLLIQSLHTYRI